MIEICYEWEDEQNRRVLEKIGENIIKEFVHQDLRKLNQTIWALELMKLFGLIYQSKRILGKNPFV